MDRDGGRPSRRPLRPACWRSRPSPRARTPGQPVTQALNPAPPDFYTCSATGGGTICRATTSQDYGPDPTGILCGSGAGAFEVTDQATRTIAATRWYDRDGNLVRRLRQISFDDARFANPLNTLSVSYHQRNTDDERFAGPGDFDSVTLYDHGVISVNLPGRGNTVKRDGPPRVRTRRLAAQPGRPVGVQCLLRRRRECCRRALRRPELTTSLVSRPRYPSCRGLGAPDPQSVSLRIRLVAEQRILNSSGHPVRAGDLPHRPPMVRRQGSGWPSFWWALIGTLRPPIKARTLGGPEGFEPPTSGSGGGRSWL